MCRGPEERSSPECQDTVVCPLWLECGKNRVVRRGWGWKVKPDRGVGEWVDVRGATPGTILGMEWGGVQPQETDTVLLLARPWTSAWGVWPLAPGTWGALGVGAPWKRVRAYAPSWEGLVLG